MKKNAAKEREETDSEILHLTKVLNEAAVTSLEIQRCREEIKLISKRLKSKEYIQSCFRPRNLLSTPDRTDEIFKDLRFFWSVGSVWEHLFEGLRLKPTASVLDIGCGFFPKVELGLYYHGFEGEVTLCEPHRTASEHASQFLKFFKVPFEARHAATTLWELKSKKYDAIVANHVLDDLILSQFAQNNRIESEALYHNEIEYEAVWRQIKNNTSFCDVLLMKLAATLLELLKSKGTILFLDYPSFSHKALGMKEIPSIVRHFQVKLRKILADAGLRELRLLEGTSIRRERLIIRETHIVSFKKEYEGNV